VPPFFFTILLFLLSHPGDGRQPFSAFPPCQDRRKPKLHIDGGGAPLFFSRSFFGLGSPSLLRTAHDQHYGHFVGWSIPGLRRRRREFLDPGCGSRPARGRMGPPCSTLLTEPMAGAFFFPAGARCPATPLAGRQKGLFFPDFRGAEDKVPLGLVTCPFKRQRHSGDHETAGSAFGAREDGAACPERPAKCPSLCSPGGTRCRLQAE